MKKKYKLKFFNIFQKYLYKKQKHFLPSKFGTSSSRGPRQWPNWLRPKAGAGHTWILTQACKSCNSSWSAEVTELWQLVPPERDITESQPNNEISFLRQWIVEAEKSTGWPRKRSILNKLPTLIIRVHCIFMLPVNFFIIKILAHELSVSVRLIKIENLLTCALKAYVTKLSYPILSYPREQSNQCCSLKVYVRIMDFLFLERNARKLSLIRA